MYSWNQYVDTIIYSNEKRIEENEQDISPSLDTGNFIHVLLFFSNTNKIVFVLMTC